LSKDHPATFLLDTNVFIEAHRGYYAVDLCPGFWDCLVHHCQEPRILSIDRVRSEITDESPLAAWVKQAPPSLFVSTADTAVAAAFRNMMAWVQSQPQFVAGAKAEFARVADGWLIAYAQVHGLVVVTHEVLAPDAK
jgi:hypothetical protein